MRPMLLGIPPHLSWGAGFEPEDVLELERKIAQASRHLSAGTGPDDL
jgi:hypothetical protein